MVSPWPGGLVSVCPSGPCGPSGPDCCALASVWPSRVLLSHESCLVSSYLNLPHFALRFCCRAVSCRVVPCRVVPGCRQHELRRGVGDGSRRKDPLTDPDIEAVVPVKEGEKASFFVLRSINHDNLAVSYVLRYFRTSALFCVHSFYFVGFSPGVV